ncbi:MAG: homocysteine S-methyltransferase family protein [Pseudomonadales bacterium]|jgi:S-methylmethionine-dependent homocysteine/selenocysteine methylase|tara:strand:+ start:6163 stop:7050 length:888 start_codon:yes stop_codon:yes gene_type:complete
MSVIVLDGGMGVEIAKRYDAAKQGLWSASVLLDRPDIVLDVHQDFIRAGARMIITNTYSTIPSYLGKAGRADDYVALTTLGGELARRAADDSGQSVQVAGSLPPLSESYRPDLVPAADVSLPIYRNLVAALRPNVDLFICETMSSAIEAHTAASQAKAFGGGKPVYVSWTLKEAPGTGLRSGETIAQAFNQLQALDVDGFLLNCTSPEAIEAGITELKGLTDKPLGGYANRVKEVPIGWTLDNDIMNEQREDITKDYFVDLCLRYVARGATIVGGCCGIGPDDIAALTQALEAQS